MRGRVNKTERVVQQLLDLEKYLSLLVYSVDGALHENRFHANKSVQFSRFPSKRFFTWKIVLLPQSENASSTSHTEQCETGVRNVLLNRLCTSDEVG